MIGGMGGEVITVLVLLTFGFPRIEFSLGNQSRSRGQSLKLRLNPHRDTIELPRMI